MIDEKLLEVLACPDCKAPVELRDDKIVCTSCGKRYSIRDGIPIMLIDEAEEAQETASESDTVR